VLTRCPTRLQRASRRALSPRLSDPAATAIAP